MGYNKFQKGETSYTNDYPFLLNGFSSSTCLYEWLPFIFEWIVVIELLNAEKMSKKKILNTRYNYRKFAQFYELVKFIIGPKGLVIAPFSFLRVPSQK